MIIIDKPYVSDLFVETASKLGIPVLNNDAVKEFSLDNKLIDKLILLDDAEFIERFKSNSSQLLYCNSENPIYWITKHLSFTNLPSVIEIFKDKAKFRKVMQPLYSDFFYKEILYKDLHEIDVSDLKFPFIIKPSIGFFSMGVYTVTNIAEWDKVKDNLHKEVENMGERFPIEVVNSNNFIIEEYIEGDEYAIDAYYDTSGKPVIINILKHIFSSDTDVSDRIYMTSKQIIENYLEPFTKFLEDMATRIDIKGFPMHVEVRVDNQGKIIPIEVNPMRFAGWCLTDIAFYAYGINVYEYFFKQKRPDWKQLLSDKQDNIYSMIIADLPKDIEVESITEVDYEGFMGHFDKPLAIRKIDYKKHGVFAFLFTETRTERYGELEAILQSDLKEFLVMK
jgi:hypothetical protein